MKIADGRLSFFQWELNQEIEVAVECAEVHFENGTMSKALPIKVKNVDGKFMCDVPNQMLQVAEPIRAFAWNTAKTCVVDCAMFVVEPRQKPEDYIYTQTEVKNFDLLFEQTKYAAEIAKQSAERADVATSKSSEAVAIAKGRATGYVFDTVSDMDNWLLDESHRSELVVGDNLYIRAVDVPDYWWDGTQVQQLETQKVNLSGYVKDTDYADEHKAGLVRLGEGLTKIFYDDGDQGEVCIDSASRADIDWKRGLKPITPLYVDYAVKTALTNPKDDAYPWGDEDRAKARETLGAIGKTDYGNAQRAGVVKVAGYDTGAYGLIKANQQTNPGAFLVQRASETEIAEGKQGYKPIVPATIDFAVKHGVAYNTRTMNQDEKKAACKWIGTLNVIENNDNTITVILPSGKQKTVDLSIIEIFT